jgi:hypothetical protein
LKRLAHQAYPVVPMIRPSYKWQGLDRDTGDDKRSGVDPPSYMITIITIRSVIRTCIIHGIRKWRSGITSSHGVAHKWYHFCFILPSARWCDAILPESLGLDLPRPHACTTCFKQGMNRTDTILQQRAQASRCRRCVFSQENNSCQGQHLTANILVATVWARPPKLY